MKRDDGRALDEAHAVRAHAVRAQQPGAHPVAVRAAAPHPVRAMLARDRFAAHAGIELVEVGDGTARARMEVMPNHLNGVDVVQGGAIFTLADFAFAAACNSHDRVAVAIDVSISYVKGVSGGTLFAEATEEALTDRLSTCLIRVTDDAGDLVALFKGTAYRKR